MTRRIVLAMSGGVDSSAAAVLLKRQGFEVIGLFMRSGATEEPQVCRLPSGADGVPAAIQLPILGTKPNKQGCCSASDAADARRVADVLDMPTPSGGSKITSPTNISPDGHRIRA
jgi:tRNA-specific 2-thiouridylase